VCGTLNYTPLLNPLVARNTLTVKLIENFGLQQLEPDNDNKHACQLASNCEIP